MQRAQLFRDSAGGYKALIDLDRLPDRHVLWILNKEYFGSMSASLIVAHATHDCFRVELENFKTALSTMQETAYEDLKTEAQRLKDMTCDYVRNLKLDMDCVEHTMIEMELGLNAELTRRVMERYPWEVDSGVESPTGSSVVSDWKVSFILKWIKRRSSRGYTEIKDDTSSESDTEIEKEKKNRKLENVEEFELPSTELNTTGRRRYGSPYIFQRHRYKATGSSAQAESMPTTSAGAAYDQVESSSMAYESIKSTIYDSTYEPVQSSSVGYEPVQSSSVGYEPVQSSSVGYEPVQSTSAGYEPVQSTSAAFASSLPIGKTGKPPLPLPSSKNVIDEVSLPLPPSGEVPLALPSTKKVPGTRSEGAAIEGHRGIMETCADGTKKGDTNESRSNSDDKVNVEGSVHSNVSCTDGSNETNNGSGNGSSNGNDVASVTHLKPTSLLVRFTIQSHPRDVLCEVRRHHNILRVGVFRHATRVLMVIRALCQNQQLRRLSPDLGPSAAARDLYWELTAAITTIEDELQDHGEVLELRGRSLRQLVSTTSPGEEEDMLRPHPRPLALAGNRILRKVRLRPSPEPSQTSSSSQSMELLALAPQPTPLEQSPTPPLQPTPREHSPAPPPQPKSPSLAPTLPPRSMPPPQPPALPPRYDPPQQPPALPPRSMPSQQGPTPPPRHKQRQRLPTPQHSPYLQPRTTPAEPSELAQSAWAKMPAPPRLHKLPLLPPLPPSSEPPSTPPRLHLLPVIPPAGRQAQQSPTDLPPAEAEATPEAAQQEPPRPNRRRWRLWRLFRRN